MKMHPGIQLKKQLLRLNHLKTTPELGIETLCFLVDIFVFKMPNLGGFSLNFSFE